jgi:Inositol hexakisphosphate
MRYLTFTFLFLIYLAAVSHPIQLCSEPLFPSIDIPVPPPLPKNFRTSLAKFSYTEFPMPSLAGLEQLHVSGSGQFTSTNFFHALQKLPNRKIIVVDLREESHGFINGIPITWKELTTKWTNVGKTQEAIEEDEIERLHEIFVEKSVVLDLDENPFHLTVSEVLTEKALVESFGAEYLRIPITDNHKPSNEQIDQIVQFILNLPETMWIHAHCHAGKGRTTTFFILYDILMNGYQVSFDEILTRQALLGGKYMLEWPSQEVKKYWPAVERYEVLKKFYEYCTTVDFTKVLFSEWMLYQPVVPSNELVFQEP